MCVVAASSCALLSAVCCLAAGLDSRGSSRVHPLPLLELQAAVRKRAAVEAVVPAKMSQLAMVSPGAPAGQDAFDFEVPQDLSPGQQFVVKVPGRGSQLMTVSPTLMAGQSVQLSYPRAPASSIVEQAKREVLGSGVQRMQKLPALAPLSDLKWNPPRPSRMEQWHNRPSPMDRSSDASKQALARWRPEEQWAHAHAYDNHLEDRLVVRKAQPTLSREVHKLRHELAADTRALNADEREERLLESEKQKLNSKLALEKNRLMHTWRQGEKELGGREEAEKEAHVLRKEATSSHKTIERLQVQFASRQADIHLLNEELAKGKTDIAQAAQLEKEKMEAEMGVDTTEMDHLKSVLRNKEAALSKANDDARELTRIRQELTKSEKAMLQMEHQEQYAKAAVWKMVSWKGDVAKKVALKLVEEQKVAKTEQSEVQAEEKKVKAQQTEIEMLKARLQTAETKSRDDTQEGIDLQANLARVKPAASGQDVVKELKNKLAQVQNTAREEAVQSSLLMAELSNEVGTLKEQAANDYEALTSVVKQQTSTIGDLKNELHIQGDQQAKTIAQLKAELNAQDQKAREADEMLQLEKKNAAVEVIAMKKELDKKDRLLGDAREKAANAPLLQKELEKDDNSIHKLWKQLSQASSKLHAVQAKEVKRGELAKNVKTLQDELEHHRDRAIQKLQDELALKESQLDEAKEETEETAKRAAEAADAKNLKAHLKDELELREELMNLRFKDAKLRDDEQDAKEATSVEKAKESELGEHQEMMVKKYKDVLKQVSDLEAKEKAADVATKTAQERAKSVLNHRYSKLHQQVRVDSKKIGRLEGELEISADEEALLQKQLVNAEAKLILAQQPQQAANHTVVNTLKGKLQVAEQTIITLEHDLDQKSSDLATEQDEVEAEKETEGKGAAMQVEEVDQMREKERKMEARAKNMSKKIEQERDDREVAEAKVVELQKMVNQDELDMSAAKSKLWSSQVQADRLRKELNPP